MDIERETRGLRRLATALTKDPTAADDLVQDTWVAALRNPPKQDRPVGPWLATVMRNRQVSALRSRRVRETHAETRGAAAAPPVPTLEQLHLSQQLLGEIAKLDPRDQSVIVLRFWEGLSARECAERLGRPASTIRTQLQRALTQLRERLDRRHGGRQAWLAAVAPLLLATTTRRTTVVSSLNAKTMTLGGLLAATVLWLGVALPQGCEVDGETAPPDDSVVQATRTAPTVAAETPTRGADRHRRVATPSTGRSATADEDPAEIDLSGYGAPTGPEGGVHPQLAVAMALRGVWEEVGACGDGSARVTTAIRFQSDGTATFEGVTFTKVDGLDTHEQQCVRDFLLARELDARKVDVTQLGHDAGTVLAYEIVGDLEIDAGSADLETLHYRPNPYLVLGEAAPKLAAALHACGTRFEMELSYEPSSGRLRPGEHDGKEQRCAAKVLAELAPVGRSFEPEHPDHEKLVCRFGLPDHERGFECEWSGPEVSGHPHPVE